MESPSLLLRGLPARPVAAARCSAGMCCSPAVQPRRGGATYCASGGGGARGACRAGESEGGMGRPVGIVERPRETQTARVSHVALWLGRCAVSPVGRLDVRVVRTAQCGAPVCWQAGLSAPAMSAHGRVDDASSKGGRAGNAAHLSRGAGRACAGALHGSAPLFVARSSVRRLWAQHSARAACSPAAARTAVRRGPRRGRPADAVR